MTESIKHTEYTSGLIDRDGNFYPCSDEGHNWLEGKLQDKGLLEDEYNSYHKVGWLVLTKSYMTECEFYFDYDKFTEGISPKQIQAIKDYKEGREEKFLNYNYSWYHVEQLDELLKNGVVNYDVPRLSCGKSGNKANQLAFLEMKGLPIPEFQTYKSYYSDSYTYDNIKNSYLIKYTDIKLVSIRSSSKYSLPGILHSELNISIDQIKDAVYKVNQSLNSDKNNKLAKAMGKKVKNASIIIQKMIRSDKNKNSGAAIVHTKNGEITGRFVINKLGEKLASNKLNGRDILYSDMYTEIKILALKIVDIYGTEQEIEFAWEDSELFVLQTREINDIQHIYEENNYHTFSYHLDKCLKQGGRNGILTKKAIDAPHILYKTNVNVSDIKYPDKCKGIISQKGHAFSHAAAICRKLNIPYVIAKKGNWKKIKSLNQTKVYLNDNILYY